MDLYTVVLDFDGGTYISQVHALSELAALSTWKSAISADVPELSQEVCEELASSLEDEQVVALSNILNVWCATATVRGKVALINIVKTIAD